MLRGQHDLSLFLLQTNFITIICSVKDKCNTSLCVRFILNLRVVCLLFNCMNDLASNLNLFWVGGLGGEWVCWLGVEWVWGVFFGQGIISYGIEKSY